MVITKSTEHLHVSSINWELYKYYLIYSQQSYIVGSIIIPLLQMKELWHQKMK